jgi:antitoxin (DNA-binding transcriptional repressor) of toxin-antitoxin stability system
MIRLNIQEAKTHLSKHIAAVERGETILLCRRNVPVAEIRPLPVAPSEPRPIGREKGRVRIPASFFEPLPEEVLEAFEGGRR